MDDAANPIEAIFAEALLQGDLERRAAYLASACGEDRRLRGRVEALIKAHEEAGNFMASPAAPSLGDTVDAAPARAAAADPLAEKPGSVIGHYKLLQRIGEGGVWGGVDGGPGAAGAAAGGAEDQAGQAALFCGAVGGGVGGDPGDFARDRGPVVGVCAGAFVLLLYDPFSSSLAGRKSLAMRIAVAVPL
jgi:hypothetical protein